MKPNLTTILLKGICLALIGLMFWLLFFSITGCEFFRKAQRSSSDTARVVKSNEVVTKTDSSTTKKASEYEKTTFIYPPPTPGDTTVINNYFPAMPRPTVIIQEKGSAQEQTNTFNYETLLKWKIDSLAASQKQSTVTTKGSVLGFWNIFAIALAGAILLVVWFKVGKK